MSKTAPRVIVIAGPNGSGKSTAAPDLLRDYLQISEFVNADVIAQGLSGFNSDAMALGAGRIMLQRLKQLASQKSDFAFETTLATRTYARWLSQLRQDGYRVHLVFLWLPSEEMAVARVASRDQRGGHDIPEDVIRRRYHAGLRNFFSLYRPVVDEWRVYDNSGLDGYDLIAEESLRDSLHIQQAEIWNTLVETYG